MAVGVAQTLAEALIAEGIVTAEADILTQAFIGVEPGAWCLGLHEAARLLDGKPPALAPEPLPPPWDMVCTALSSRSNGTRPDEALVKALAGYPAEVQDAIITAIGIVIAQSATPPRPASVASNPRYLVPIDATFLQGLQAILGSNGLAISRRRKEAGEHVVDWLGTHGHFIRTPYGGLYYLYEGTCQLYGLAGEDWSAFLYLLTGCNQAGVDHKYLLADTRTAAMTAGEVRDVMRVAHWSESEQMLRVSRFDGSVYRLDGQTIERESNGEGPVLFEDDLSWQPYTVDTSAKGAVLDWSLRLPHWEHHEEESYLLYRAWWLATFFPELCPTKPILTLKGERGSGKTMACRVLMRLLGGPLAEVYGLPDKADAFVTMMSHGHIVVLDNLDTLMREIRDKLALISTGKVDSLRKLYSTNEEVRIRYRCWLAVTSRFPETLQRDDLVDRTLILPVKHIDDGDRRRESLFLVELLAKRNQWWGDTLTALNAVVADIRRNGLPHQAGLRMEDWATLGSVIARTSGHEHLWPLALSYVVCQQTEMLLDDPIVEGIEAWLHTTNYTPSPVQTRQLYEWSKLALYGGQRADGGWPRSVRSFGRRLAGLQRELRTKLKADGYEMSWHARTGYLWYSFVQVP